MPTIADIDAAARRYAEARERLAAIVATLKEGLEALKQEHTPGIRRALARASGLEIELRQRIEDAPELFERPRTVVLHGLKLGYVKGRGAIAWADPDQVVRLIRKHLPDQAETLIVTEERPSKTALAQLSVADLKRIGCTVTEAGDEIVIKPTDGEVGKMVAAMIKDVIGEEAQ